MVKGRAFFMKIDEVLKDTLKGSSNFKGISKILNREALSVDESKIEDKVNLLFDRLALEIKQSFQNYEKETKNKLSLKLRYV